MIDVSIYLESSASGPGRKGAAGVWWVECKTGKPEPAYRRGYIWREETTENAMELELLVSALGILIRPCSIRVSTRCGLLLNAMKERKKTDDSPDKKWIERWAESGWQNAKGKPLGNAALWQQAHRKLQMHLAGFYSGGNPRLEEMQEALEIVKESRGRVDPWKNEKM